MSNKPSIYLANRFQQAIAALLHDVPEDCDGEPRLTEIKATFGIRVKRIVRACSEPLTF